MPHQDNGFLITLRAGDIMGELPTSTVTFVFTDIEGSTRLWEQDPEAMRRALARHDALLRAALEAQGGTVFKTIGDQFCAAFATAPPALAAALEAQRALQAEPQTEADPGTGPAQRQVVRSSGHQDITPPLRVRLALHTGTAEERDGDYFGPALSRVHRLLQAAHGGQTLLSAATTERVRNALPVGASLRSLGAHRLKDFPQPEQIFQLVHPDLPSEFPPLRSLERAAHNLPRQLSRFVGREQEIAAVRRLLASTDLLTLTGTGGCGKTRLALQVAAGLVEEYTDGVWLVELASLTDRTLVPQSVAAALGIREEPGRPVTQTLVDWLRAKQLLLVLDNCEHLLADCAQLVEALLRACSSLRILATSREPLRVAGETVWPVPSFSLPPLNLQSSTLTQYEAVHLFIDRASAVSPGFVLTDRNAPFVAQVCHRLDGIPLAIELAATRVKVLSMEQIAQRLNDRFRLLTGGSRTALPRQQTLRATMDWSYGLLSEAERTLLRRLSVFARGFTLEAAEAVCSDFGYRAPPRSGGRLDFGLPTELPPEAALPDPAQREVLDCRRISPQSKIQNQEALDLLAALIEKSLVVYEEQEERARYRLLETVRQYSRDRLFESGEEERVRKQHVAFFLKLAEEAEAKLRGVEGMAWLSRLEAEHDNLRAALEWSLETDPGAGLQLAAALWWFWKTRGYYTEGRERLARLLAAPGASGRSGDPARTAARARALTGAGVLATDQGDYPAGRRLCEEGLALARDLKDKAVIASCLNNLGSLAWCEGDYAGARRFCEESLTLARELDNKQGIANALYILGTVSRDQGDGAAARVFMSQCLALRRVLGDRQGVSRALYQMGYMAIDQEDLGEARALLEESLALARHLGDQDSLLTTLIGLGTVARRQGDDQTARSRYEESLAIAQQLGSIWGCAYARTLLGNLAFDQRRYDEARALFQESLMTYQSVGSKKSVAWSLNSLGSVALCQSDSEMARAYYEASLAAYQELGDRRGMVSCLEGLAGVAGGQGRSAPAARLFAAAAALRAMIHVPLHANERAGYEGQVAAVRAAMGEAAFAAAWKEGEAMSLEQALAEARAADPA